MRQGIACQAKTTLVSKHVLATGNGLVPPQLSVCERGRGIQRYLVLF